MMSRSDKILQVSELISRDTKIIQECKNKLKLCKLVNWIFGIGDSDILCVIHIRVHILFFLRLKSVREEGTTVHRYYISLTKFPFVAFLHK